MLREEGYSSEGASSDGYEGGLEESFSARAGSGFDRVAKSAECEGDVQCRAAITAMTPAEKAGVQQDPEGVDGAGASAGADNDCGAAGLSQSEKFWADVGGSPPDPTCNVGGDGADRGELAGGGMKAMGLRWLVQRCRFRRQDHVQRLPWALVPRGSQGRGVFCG